MIEFLILCILALNFKFFVVETTTFALLFSWKWQQTVEEVCNDNVYVLVILVIIVLHNCPL